MRAATGRLEMPQQSPICRTFFACHHIYLHETTNERKAGRQDGRQAARVYVEWEGECRVE